jgi:hypothetical protein
VRLAFAAVAGVLFGVSILHAQQANEYQVKAAYLYNFGRFVGWPSSANSDPDFVICILGRDPFGSDLDTTLSGEHIGGKRVAARRITKPQDASNCRMLFISSSEESHLKEILGAVDRPGILTVSDIPRFSQQGGMIEFVLEGNKVRFEVNLKRAESAGLSLSSDLLKVAVAVRRNAGD